MAKIDVLTKGITAVRNALPTVTKTIAGTTKQISIIKPVVEETGTSVKLFDDIINFVGESLSKLKEISMDLPNDLYKQLEDAIGSKNFELKQIVSKYYSKLDECKTIDDVKKLYPEFNFPAETINERLNLSKEEYENIILELMRKHYIGGERISKIKIPGGGVKKEYSYATFKNFQIEIPNMDRYALNTIEGIEKRASKIKKLSVKGITPSELTSSVLEKAWKKDHLKSEFASIAKHWEALKPIWNKKNGTNINTSYQTQNLVDTYLASKYVSGMRNVDNPNPFTKYFEMEKMDNSKQRFINLVYRFAKQGDEYSRVINSKGFQDFKAKFNTDEMIRMFDDMESHYQKAFLKSFWSEDRKSRFSKAIIESMEIAKQNFEFSDDLLKHASETMFV